MFEGRRPRMQRRQFGARPMNMPGDAQSPYANLGRGASQMGQMVGQEPPTRQTMPMQPQMQLQDPSMFSGLAQAAGQFGQQMPGMQQQQDNPFRRFRL